MTDSTLPTLYLSGTVAERSAVWPLDQPSVRMGRSSKNAIHLPDGTVSKEHAEVERRGGRYYVRDLGSRNGTRVNGVEAREPLEIKSGDRLEVGHVALRVTDQDPGQVVQFSDGTILSSSLRMRADQILQRRSQGTASDQMVHLLADAGRLLVLPRPLKETCEELLQFVERAVPASRYVILLQQQVGSEPVQIAARTRAGRANQPLGLSRSIMQTVLDECTSVLTGDAALDPRFRGQQSIVAQAVHSAMAVPLFDNQKVLGLIYVDSQDLAVTFREDQLELLTLLANMAAVKITNARLLEAEQARARMAQELATATQIQRGLLPALPPEVPGYEVEAFLETCFEVGGDLYDFYLAPDGRLLFVLGDVSGKGMGAALLMSSFLASARVLYDTCTDPGELATRLGSIMNRSTTPGRFVTGIVGCLDPGSGLLHYVNAGHPSPCLVLGAELRQLESTGVPFGILPQFSYRSDSVEIRPGELMAIFSDGIPEAQRGEEFFDDERLHRVLLEGAASDLPGLRSQLMAQVEEFLGEEPRSDDITLVLLRRSRAGADPSRPAEKP